MAFQKPNRPVERIFLHCSASDAAAHDNVATMREWHLGRGWSDVGYHFFIRKDGTVEAGRQLEEVPAAQKGHNTGTIAICLHGLDPLKFTEDQYLSVALLCREINAVYSEQGVTFHGHREVANKECPVFPYREVLGLDEHGEMTAEPNPQPSVAPVETSQLPVLRMPSRGMAVRRLQQLLVAAGIEVTVDGHFGQATEAAVRELQEERGLEVDGIVGPRTWEVLGG